MTTDHGRTSSPSRGMILGLFDPLSNAQYSDSSAGSMSPDTQIKLLFSHLTLCTHTGDTLLSMRMHQALNPLFKICRAGALALLLLCALGLTTTQAHAVSSGTVVAPNDSRFDAVGGFTLREWSGINNVFGNATLIAPDRVILPRHLINSTYKNRRSVDGAASQYVVRFRRSPDGTIGNINTPSTFFHVGIQSWILPTGRNDADDVVIGILETPVFHIQPIQLDLRAKLSRNQPVTVASWGPEAPPAGVVVPKGRLLVGSMRLSSASKSKLSFSAPSRLFPARVVKNDSGAPVLLVSGSSVRMVGFATTTSSGVALAQQDGSRLFPRRR